MTEEKYPQKIHIQEHKDELYQRLLLYYCGIMDLTLVEGAFRALAGDAGLEAKNYFEKTVQDISELDRKLKELPNLRVTYRE